MDCTAIIAQNPNQGNLLLERNPVLKDQGAVFRYTESKPEVLFPVGNAWAPSYMLPLEPRFSRIASHGQLFASDWCKNYLNWLSGLLLPGGCVMLPFKGDENQHGFMTPAQIADFYQTQGNPVPGTILVAFCPNGTMKTSPSVRGWFQENNHRLLLEELRNKHRGMFDPRPENPDTCIMLDNPEALDELLAADKNRQELSNFYGVDSVVTDLEGELKDIIRKYTYVVGSIQYKSALIEHIIETLHPHPQGLDLLDIGGNMGCLAVELLLSGKGLIGNALNRELDALSFLQSLLLYGSFREQLRGSFYFSIGNAQRYDFAKKFDVVTIIGTLLLVPREHHVEMLSKAWASLRPGGLLIVHENMKKASYTRDYNLMFEPEELDSLLNRFGRVHRYPNTSCSEVSAEQAQRQSVFRVVQKG